MSRPLRIQVADGWYHVTARGIDRKAVFRDDADRAHFLQLLEDMVGPYRVCLHAYVLMDNHYHLPGYRSKPGWLQCEALWARSKRGGLDARRSYRQWIEEYLRQGIEESVMAGLTAAVAIGSVAFAERLRRQVKGDGTEQPDVRRWRRLMPFGRVVAAVEKVKGEGWLDFCDRRGDWGRDLALWLGREHCGLTLRELGAAAQGMAYPAVSKATKRMAERLQRDRRHSFHRCFWNQETAAGNRIRSGSGKACMPS